MRKHPVHLKKPLVFTAGGGAAFPILVLVVNEQADCRGCLYIIFLMMEGYVCFPRCFKERGL